MSENYPWIIWELSSENYQWELSSENYDLVYHYAEKLRFIGIQAYPKTNMYKFFGGIIDEMFKLLSIS